MKEILGALPLEAACPVSQSFSALKGN